MCKKGEFILIQNMDCISVNYIRKIKPQDSKHVQVMGLKK